MLVKKSWFYKISNFLHGFAKKDYSEDLNKTLKMLKNMSTCYF